MKAGRELDALIAEKVMGFVKGQCSRDDFMEFAGGWRCSNCGYEGEWDGSSMEHERQVPHYSTDISAAWEVVEKLQIIVAVPGSVDDEGCTFTHYTAICGDAYEWGDTAPHAICLAALKVVGVEI